ncbi:MAG: biotin transporter BioY [Actinomycetes bacterium]
MSSEVAGPVVVDSWAEKSVVKNVTLVLGLTLFTALCAQVSVPLPFTPVPLTLQTFAVLAGAAALGAERSVIAQVIYVVLAVAGAPVLAGGASGMSSITGPTGGYIVGFVAASYVVGRIAERGATRQVVATVSSYVAGTAVIYVLGVSWLSFATHMSVRDAIVAGMIPFLIGDALKALAAGAALPSAWKLTGSASK